MDGIVIRDARRGGRISAQERNDLARAMRAGRLLAGPGIRLTRTPNGTTISAVPDRAPGGRVAPGADVVVGRIVSAVSGEPGSYSVSAGRTTYRTDIIERALLQRVPSGTRVIVHPVLCRVAAGD